MAAKTWGDIISEARIILQDTETPYRWSDSVLLSKLNRGLQELARLRPDAFWDYFYRDDVIVPRVVETDDAPVTDPDEFDPEVAAEVAVGDVIDIPMQFYTPLVYWVVGSAELTDDEFTNDGRAAMLLAQFKTSVVTL